MIIVSFHLIEELLVILPTAPNPEHVSPLRFKQKSTQSLKNCITCINSVDLIHYSLFSGVFRQWHTIVQGTMGLDSWSLTRVQVFLVLEILLRSSKNDQESFFPLHGVPWALLQSQNLRSEQASPLIAQSLLMLSPPTLFHLFRHLSLYTIISNCHHIKQFFFNHEHSNITPLCSPQDILRESHCSSPLNTVYTI